MLEIGCFISPHGYGHATRCIGVVEALQELIPELRIQIITTVPQSLFSESLTNFNYHPLEVDVGLVQSAALAADLSATVNRLNHLLPYSDSLIDQAAEICGNCSLILCDIAPLGILVAEKLQIPSVLVESFTWDWIYEPYLSDFPGLRVHAKYFKKLFDSADFRVQTEPLCATTRRDFYCGPIARKLKNTQQDILTFLGCDDRKKKIVLITMGGIAQDIPVQETGLKKQNHLFVFTGQKETRKINENLFLVDRKASLYHPDLIATADLVVCKAGYSTVAECSQAGSRVLSVGRDDFAESGPLQNFLIEHLGSTPISTTTYESGEWLSMVPELLQKPKPVVIENSAREVAAFLKQIAG